MKPSAWFVLVSHSLDTNSSRRKGDDVQEIAYVNGVLSSVEDAHVSIDDRGLQFGDGVYEVVRSYDGRLWALERHLRRLERSLRSIWIESVSVGDIGKAVVRAYEASQIPNALVYFQITRGVSARDYAWTDDIEPTVIVTVRHMPVKHSANREDGVAVVTHPEIRWGRVDIKSLNLLGNMIAKKAARDAGAYEAIFIDRDGVMTEGASTSLFIVSDGRLITRENGPHILPGITRELVLECAQDAAVPIEERPFTLDELHAADEIILTGTTFGVYSVVMVDGVVVRDGKPGSIGRELHRRYNELVKNEQDAPREARPSTTEATA